MIIERVSTPLTLAQKLAVVPLPELRRHLRITELDDDWVLAEDIEAAYDYLSGPEGWLGGLCLLEEEFYAYAAGPLRGTFEIPLRPLRGSSLLSFDYLGNGTGTYLPMDSANYNLSSVSDFAVVAANSFVPWPYWGAYNRRAYRIRFKAGFGTTRESIPSPLRKAIRMLVGYWYQQRETVGEVGRTVAPKVHYGMESLCREYRVLPDHS